ncbi:MAG: WD40 repeat domain-containing protein [Chitinophagales bacterium]|nr:WD40 repeat domain-containing protein [Chitinophagales bacterium]
MQTNSMIGLLFSLLTLPLWAQETLKATLQNTLSAHRGGVEFVTYNPQNTLVATGGHDHLIHLKDVVGTRPLQTLTAHTDTINEIRFNKKGDQILSCSADGTVKLWDVASGNVLHSWAAAPRSSIFKNVFFACFSPDEQSIYLGGNGAKLKKVSLNEPEPKTVFTAKFYITSAQITPDQKYLAFATGKDVHLLNLSTDQVERTITYQGGVYDFVNDIVFSPDGKLMAVWCQNGTINIWQYPSMENYGSIRAGDKNTYSQIAFSPDSRWIASGSAGNAFRIWDVLSQKMLLDMPHHKRPVRTFSFNHNGTSLVAGSYDGAASIWDLHWESAAPPPPPPPPPTPTPESLSLNNTNIVTKSTIKVKSLDIVIDVWDEEQEDGDVLSLALNEQTILEDYRLIKLRKSTKAHINANGTNLLVLYAKDLGKSPPNTAALAIYDGKRTQIVRLSSDFKDSQAIGIVYDPQGK